MGMDVYGRKPTNKDGEYFRANVWSWRVILGILVEANNKTGKPLSQSMMNNMGMNNGAGPRSQKKCNKLADAIEEIVNSGSSIYYRADSEDLSAPRGDEFSLPLESSCTVDKDGRFLSPAEAKKLPKSEIHSPYHTDVEHVTEFIAFLRSCGGFRVC